MNPQNRRHEIAMKPVVLTATGMDAVGVRRDIPYAVIDGETLTMDVYSPSTPEHISRQPVVLFVTGYSDVGMRNVMGCNAKDMASYDSWARLVAASGLVAITYTNHQPADVHAALRHVREHSTQLGIDAGRLAIWACSGNVPTALSVAMDTPGVRCAVLLYGYMLDLDGSTVVEEASTTCRFANPSARRLVGDLPVDVPLFIARAGRDEMPHLNETIDRFVAAALDVNLPVSLVNHSQGPHAFDIVDASQASRAVVGQILRFLGLHLNESV